MARQNLYPPAVKSAIKSDYLAGRYDSKGDLCKAWGLPRPATLSRWIRLEGWDLERDEMIVEAQEVAKSRIGAELAEVNVGHFETLEAFHSQILLHIKAAGELGDPMPIHDIAVLTRAMESIIMGQRRCLGAIDGEDERGSKPDILALFLMPAVREAAARYEHPHAIDVEAV